MLRFSKPQVKRFAAQAIELHGSAFWRAVGDDVRRTIIDATVAQVMAAQDERASFSPADIDSLRAEIRAVYGLEEA